MQPVLEEDDEDELLQTKLIASQYSPIVQKQVDPGVGYLLATKASLQAQVAVPDSDVAIPPIVREVLLSPGQPLDRATRAFMEPRFGRDFGSVRIHTGTQANHSAGAINAQAFTVNRNIVFASGKYMPDTRAGKQLLAHELAHILQQCHQKYLPDGPEVSTVGEENSDGVLDQKRRELSSINTSSNKQELLVRQSNRGQLFEHYLNEAAQFFVQHKDEGLSFGTAPSGHYDPQRWERPLQRPVIRAIVAPSKAMAKLVEDVGNRRKITDPQGYVRPVWSVDCLEFTQLIRTYAYWKSLSESEFDTKFRPLELGVSSLTDLEWIQDVQLEARKPHEYPRIVVRRDVVQGIGAPEPPELLTRTWAEVLRIAPVGTHIQWRNRDMAKKCTPPRGARCSWENEHATKLGPDKYAAWDIGVTSELDVKRQMGAAALGIAKEKVPLSYINANIYIALMRFPQQLGSHKLFKMLHPVNAWGIYSE